MHALEHELDHLRHQLDRLAVAKAVRSEQEPPLFVNVGQPPRTEEELDRLLAQDAG